MNEQWRERNRPPRLEKRYQFDCYDSLRDFLDRAADLSEREGYYPDIGFGRDYVNVTIHAEEGETELADERHRFAQLLDELLGDKAQ
jgi:pterin-4a-carbinolamine dehydratase